MERSALYRRALAPVMILAGSVGILGAALGCWQEIKSPAGFVGYWMALALTVIAGAFWLVRRQAKKSSEPFWSPPTRRVAQALSMPLTIGFILGLVCLDAGLKNQDLDLWTGTPADAGKLNWLPAVWALCYGCALHAAGFFVIGSLRRFAWLFSIVAAAFLLWGLSVHSRNLPLITWQTWQGLLVESWLPSWQASHCQMGSLFGFLQLAYGIYLYFTEKKNPAA